MQISEWEAYDRLDPIGEWRADFRIAQLRATIVNIAKELYPEKGVKPVLVTPLEMMPDWDGTEEKEVVQQSVEEQKRILFGIANVQKKRIRKEKSL